MRDNAVRDDAGGEIDRTHAALHGRLAALAAGTQERLAIAPRQRIEIDRDRRARPPRRRRGRRARHPA